MIHWTTLKKRKPIKTRSKVKRETKTGKDIELLKVEKKKIISPRENWDIDMNRQLTEKKCKGTLTLRWLIKVKEIQSVQKDHFKLIRLAEAMRQHCW